MTEGKPATASASRIAIALPSADSDVSGTRSMLQERIGLWAMWVCVLSSTFYIVNIVAWPLVASTSGVLDMLVHRGPMLHLVASVWFGSVWLLTRTKQLSLQALRVLDLATLIIGCGLYAWMGNGLARAQEMVGYAAVVGVYTGLLAATSVVVSRAITVPSTAARTFWASIIAMLPIGIVAWITTGVPADSVYTTTWCGVSIAIATVGSRVVYGLRSEAARVRRLGQYTLEEKVGAGGMGVVYRARHAMLRRPTAIKLLPPDRAGEANLVRFEREVQLTAELSHPNTISIYDYGRTPDGIFYYAMEYLDGINLEELVRRERFVPPGRVIYILRQVCGALGEAHGRGLLHRDIKPANIILTERGGEPDVAKVVDFGLVKPIVGAGPDITMSTSIVLAGTPLYMAPEALTAPASVDARSDLYALGAVGYFLLTGQPVFDAQTVAEAFGHHLHTTPVPPSQRVAHPIPPDLEALILRCLSKDVSGRPPSARALERELKKCSAVSSWTTEHATEWWRRFRESGSPSPGSAGVDSAEQITMTVDLSERIARQPAGHPPS